MRPRSVTIRKAFTLAIRSLRRLYLTPERAVIGLLMLEGLLFLSEWGKWFEFNRHKGWTVLINLAVVILALGFLTGWFSWAWFWRWKFQLGLRGMLLLVASTAVACGWLTNEIRRAKELAALRGRVEERLGCCCFRRLDYSIARKVDDRIESVLGESFVTGCESAHFTMECYRPLSEAKQMAQAKRDIQQCVDLSPQTLTSVTFGLPGDISQDLRLLSRCPNLSNLGIAEAKIDGPALAAIGTMTKLESLDFNLDDDLDLSPLAKLPNLSHLTIRGKLTDQGLDAIGRIKSLILLEIGQTDVTSTGLRHLAGLTKLEWLDLHHTKVTCEGLEFLPARLEGLSLGQCALRNGSNRHFRRLVHLKRLDLRATGISDEALTDLPTSLENLNLSECRLTPERLQNLARLTNVQSLNLSNTIASDSADELIDALPPSLETLYLSGNRITNDGLRRLKRLTKLQLLDLSNTLVTDEGLAYLHELPKLTHLTLNETCIRNPAELFRHNALEDVDLCSTLIDDESLRELPISATIRDLNLNGTQLGDEGFTILKKRHKLQYLSTVNTNVTDAAREPDDPFK